MKSTTRFSKNKRGIECLNCGQPISDKDNFCSDCGQVNDLKRVSIKQFVTEFFSGFFSFDTRFFKTFVPLLFKPGKVSKEYIEGKRKKYVNPFQLYLNVSIVFFLLIGLFSALDEYTISDRLSANYNEKKLDINYTANTPTDSTQIEFVQQKLSLRMDSIFNTTNFLDHFKNDSISKVKKDSIYNKFRVENTDFINEIINKSNGGYGKFGNTPTLDYYSENYTRTAFEKNFIDYNPNSTELSYTNNDYRELFGNEIGGKINAFIDYDMKHKDATPIQAMIDLNYKKTRWNAFYFKTAQNINKSNGDKEFQKTWFKSVISKISIALFFLLPIFTLFLSLLYIRGKWNYTEHLVFVFNIQTVFFLLLIFFMVFDRITGLNIGNYVFTPLFLFYLFRALRNFYGQHWFKTTLKFMVLNIVYLILALVGFILVSFIAFIL